MTRGGGRNYEALKRDILRIQKQESGSDVFFTTMIDLYAIPHEFPALADAAKLAHMPHERVALLESAFAGDIPDRRFIPHLQLHEFETPFIMRPIAPHIRRSDAKTD